MLQIYACITQQHDLWLLLLAGAVCSFGAWVSLNLVARAVASTARMRTIWVAAGAAATGGGIWATHFVAMLAFQSSLPVGYDIPLTALSIVIAVLGSGVGIALSISSLRHAPALGGIMIGLATGAMHYTGMAAFEAPADLVYDPRYVVASLVIGALLGAAAMVTALQRRSLRHRAFATLLLVLSICGLHFTGMTAVALVPDPLVPLSDQIMAPDWLAIAVAAIATMIMALGLTGALVDQRLADRAAEETSRLRASEERFRQLADATFEGIVIHRDGMIVDANRAMAELLGHSQNGLIDRRVMDFVAPDHREEVLRHRELGLSGKLEIELVHADGQPILVEVHGQAITHEGQPARVVAVRDIRERKHAEERIRHMAHHDMLTGLPNRTLFLDRMTVALANARHDGSSVALLYLDLDRFKSVNDLLGHQAGDLLLQQVSQRLTDNLRERDTVARLSGDEFVILQPLGSQLDGTILLAERLIKSLTRSFAINGQTVSIGACIGIALFPQDGDDPEQLMVNADTALYRAKTDGRATFRFYEAVMDERIHARRRLERDLRQALDANALSVHYQPQVDCKTQKLLGLEALVRWHHPEHGMIPPAEFVPLAEESGLILPLGDWVLRTACRDALAWPEDIQIAVNLSSLQFKHPDIATSILSTLAEVNFPPNRLEIEVTESVLIDDTERALAALSSLKAAGVRIALDDFGTGYSSLSYLQKFAFDKLKIDRSFISAMTDSRQTHSIVRTIVALAKSLNITVTAEGVETEEQLRMLQDEACNQVQGYLIGRPSAKESMKQMAC